MQSRIYIILGTTLAIGGYLGMNVLTFPLDPQLPTLPIIGGPVELLVTPLLGLGGFVLGYSFGYRRERTTRVHSDLPTSDLARQLASSIDEDKPPETEQQ